MKHYKFTFLLLICSFTIDAQLPEKVISQYFKAIGGLENWKKVERIDKKQHMKIGHDKAFDFIIRIYVQNSKGFRFESFINKGTPTVMALFEDKGWVAMNFSLNLDGEEESSDSSHTMNGIYDLPDSVVLKDQWKKYILHDLTNYKSKSTILSSLGTFENINGEQAIGVKMLRNNLEYLFYFSCKTHYLLQFKTNNIQVNYDNYKDVEKLKIPFEVEEMTLDHRFERGGKIIPFSITYVLDEVRINPKFDESIFFKPKN
jgi:hypothetical protein